MTAKLRISEEVALPLDWATFATVVYGARGAGKTTFGRVVAEECHKAGIPFCVLEPKGDWWGLKSSADGRSEGIPIVVFGGDRADLPLEPTAGAYLGRTVAELAEKGVSAVLDLEHFSKGKQVRFAADFFEALYDKNRQPLLVMVDEVQRFAPQGGRGLDPDYSRCLGAVEDLVKLGRKHGIGFLGFTQRGAGLNKEVSELCDVLVAFRTPGPLDQERVKDWLDANATVAERTTVMGMLAKLPTGTAILASGHPSLQLFQTVAIRRPETFDSSATPKIGQRRVEPKRLAQPDLERLRVQMADTIERAKADDPKELRKRIVELERGNRLMAEAVQAGAQAQQQLNELKAHPVEKVVRIEVPVFPRAVQDWLLDIARQQEQIAKFMREGVEEHSKRKYAREPDAQADDAPLGRGAQVNGGHLAPAPRPAAAGVPGFDPIMHSGTRVAGAIREAESTERLGKGEQTVLAILSQWPDGRTHNELAFLAGYSAKASTLGVILAKLRRAGLVEAGQPIRATKAGIAAAGGAKELPRGQELLNHWMRHPRMGEGERRVLEVLINAHPEALPHDRLAELTGYSAGASTLGVILSKLRKLGLVEKGARRVPDEFMESIA